MNLKDLFEHDWDELEKIVEADGQAYLSESRMNGRINLDWLRCPAFNCPFEELPLYINAHQPNKWIMQWRLRLGK